MHAFKNLALVFSCLLVFAHGMLPAQTDSLEKVKVITLQVEIPPIESGPRLKIVPIYGAYSANQDLPFSYTEVRQAQIEQQNYGQEPSFLLSTTPAVTVYSDAGSYQGYSYFRMRGIDQTRINMSLNGVPLNEPEDQGAYFSNFPDFLNSISRVQIGRGVGTSRNGAAAYAGNMQFFGPSINDTTYTEFGLGYGSFNSYRAYGELNLSKPGEKGLYLRASHLHSDGFKDHSDNTSSSAYYQGFISKGGHKLTLSGFLGQQKNQMAWLGASRDSLDANPRFNANAEQEDDLFRQSLTMLEHRWNNRQFLFHSAIYFNYLDGNYDFDFNNFLELPSTDELYNYAFRSHFAGAYSNVTWFRDKFQLTAGIHANTYSRRHLGSEASLGELYRNTGYRQEASAFAKFLYRLADDKINLFADLQGRYSRFAYEGIVPLDPLDWKFLNPKGGITWHPRQSIDIYYSLGRTGREPTRTDMFIGNDDLLADSLGNPVLGNTNPEYVLDHELGFRIKRKKWNLSANLYFMDFENEIVLNGQFGPNALALTENVDQSYRAGLELEAGWQIVPSLSTTHASSFNTSRITEGGTSFTPILTPAVIVNQGLEYRRRKFTIGLEARYQSSSWLDFANTEQLDGYFLLNAHTSYLLGPVRLILRVNNLTNATYFNNGYVDYDLSPKYFLQAPINFRASAVWRF